VVNTRSIARLGMLAVGLGIGAAAAHTPLASADTSNDWLSSVDGLLSGASPAAPLDIQISIDGTDLFPTLGNSATAVSGMGDIAIAFGSGASATAEGGFGDYALADASTGGIGAVAVAGDQEAGATGNNFDFASASGNGSEAFSGNEEGAPDTTGSSFDFASASGTAGAGIGPDEAIAGQNGSGDFASVGGENVEAFSGLSTTSTPANFDSASVWGNSTTATTDTTEAIAGSQDGAGGSSDTAFVVDPFGTLGSSAFAGDGFNSDVAGVFGDALNATAITANNVIDILPSL
jgi:hypothetical protein